MRIDQDIHFQAKGVPVLMRLDTTAPFNRWIITPEREEDEHGAFAEAISSAIPPDFGLGVVVADDSAIVRGTRESGASISHNIFASLPEWDGESLDGLIGAEEFANFLQYIKDCAEVDGFRRSDGRLIEFEDYLLD